MRTGILVQVRLGSTRLPRKALLPLAGDTVLGHAMRALQEVPADVRVLATDTASGDELAPVARAAGFTVLAGRDEDVLGRFCDAARELGIDRLIRATGDNPLVCPRLAREILAIHEARGADLSHFLGIPWGTGVEVLEAEALRAADRAARAPDEREHLTTWIYRNRQRFTVVEEQGPEDCRLPEARVSVDTFADYALVQRIFAALYRGAPLEAQEVVRWLRSAGEGCGGRA